MLTVEVKAGGGLSDLGREGRESFFKGSRGVVFALASSRELDLGWLVGAYLERPEGDHGVIGTGMRFR